MASLTGLSGMGTITREDSDKNSNLFKMAMPASDASASVILDLFGVDRVFTVNGRFVTGDSGYSTVALFIAALDLLAAGNQTSRSYVSDKTGATYKVLVDRVSWKAEAGDVNGVEYTLTLIQGNV